MLPLFRNSSGTERHQCQNKIMLNYFFAGEPGVKDKVSPYLFVPMI